MGKTNQEHRERWLAEVIGALPAGTRILDAGAGETQYRTLCGHLRYVSQDFAMYDGAGDGRGLQTGQRDSRGLDLVCDITAIPEPDASFDAVMCIEVLEHLPEPIVALREFARLLRAGGKLVLTAPFCSLTHYAPYHYSTGFGRYFYEKHLPELGFRIERIDTNGNYFEYLAQELHRTGWVAEKYADTTLNKRETRALEDALAVMARLSRADRGSSELLCFGLHVLAVKAQ